MSNAPHNQITSIFANFPDAALSGQMEIFEELLSQPNICIERIVSTGQASPPNFWYCQPRGEWVILLKGSAGLQFSDDEQCRELHPGDFVNIPAQCRHRVAWTAPNVQTVWLAIHYVSASTDHTVK